MARGTGSEGTSGETIDEGRAGWDGATVASGEPMAASGDEPAPDDAAGPWSAAPRDADAATAADTLAEAPFGEPAPGVPDPTSPLSDASLAAAPGLRPEPLHGRADPQPSPRRRSGFGALLLGGLIAAALGFGAAWLARDQLAPTALAPAIEARLAALEARPAPETFADPAPRLDELAARLAALEAAVPPAADLGPLREELEAAAAAAVAAQDEAARLADRLAALEAGPATAPGEAGPATTGPATDPAAAPEALRGAVLAALEPRLGSLEEAQAALAARLDAAEAAADGADATAQAAEAEAARAREEAARAAEALAAAQADAEAATRRAGGEAALLALDAALAAGEPLAPALGTFEATGAPAPEALAALAETGAPTLAALRDGFPEAARAGLAAGREAGLTDAGGGVGATLRSWFSVRSIAPREGDDPDAVLSRAQAALDQGRLAPALAEVASLPEPVRAAMGPWIAEAEARARADAALEDLRAAPQPVASEPVAPEPAASADPSAPTD